MWEEKYAAASVQAKQSICQVHVVRITAKEETTSHTRTNITSCIASGMYICNSQFIYRLYIHDTLHTHTHTPYTLHAYIKLYSLHK